MTDEPTRHPKTKREELCNHVQLDWQDNNANGRHYDCADCGLTMFIAEGDFTS